MGERCVECNTPIRPTDRGVLTACSERIFGGFDLDIGDRVMRVCGYHLSCWLESVVGGVPSFEVLSRLPTGNERARSTTGEESVSVVGTGWHTSEDLDEQINEGVSEAGD